MCKSVAPVATYLYRRLDHHSQHHICRHPVQCNCHVCNPCKPEYIDYRQYFCHNHLQRVKFIKVKKTICARNSNKGYVRNFVSFTTTFSYDTTFGEMLRFVYGFEFHFVFGTSWRYVPAPGTFTFLIGLFFGCNHFNEITAKCENEIFINKN